MVEYATKDLLRRKSGITILAEKQRIIKRAQDRSPSGSTFLSHSSKDLDWLPDVINILETHGALVYVDKKDETLPPYTSDETAKALRDRIVQCQKFILFSTKNSKDSRWVPWELGLSDGLKGGMKTAVFPGADTSADTKWSEQEYLGVYDRIVWGSLEGFPDEVWMVWKKSKNTATELSKWISS